jgi:hypothetical protein
MNVTARMETNGQVDKVHISEEFWMMLQNITINNIKVVDEKELGPTITKLNKRNLQNL